MATEEDCWDAFGSDDEEEEEDTNIVQGQQDATAVALHLSQFFLKQNSQFRLSDRVVGLVDESQSTHALLKNRGMNIVEDTSSLALDVIVVMDATDEIDESLLDMLLPGGILVSPKSLSVAEQAFLEPPMVCFSANGRCLPHW